MEPIVVVHGGAGGSTKDIALRLEGVRSACEEGYQVIKNKTALDAVEAAVKILEDNPLFNAGNAYTQGYFSLFTA